MLTTIKIVAIIIEAIFLIWFIVPIGFHIFKAGNILGVFLCVTALFRTAFSATYHQLQALMLQNTLTKILWFTVHLLYIAFLIYAVVVSICMFFAMKQKPDQNATAVILGAQVKPWGASRLLKQRIKAAEDYLNRSADTVAVASGGQGINEPISEAICINQNMIADGIAPDRIYIEDRSVNTEQNLLYSVTVIHEHHLNDSIAIVSDSYHQLRARIIAHKIDRRMRVGAVNTVNTKFGYLIYPSFFVREWIAIPVEIIKKLGRPAKHRKI